MNFELFPNPQKILIICGPTATGKTKLGIKLAKKFDGEIVSADSRQVYRGMDIGTGKDLPINAKFKAQNEKLHFNVKNFKIGYYRVDEIPLWLLDIVEPSCRFNVADYRKCAEVVIKDILKRGKLPIMVGGTGFYIKALVDGIETMGIEPDWKLRERLSNCQVAKLQNMLARLDFKRYQEMNESDRQNPRRLIRAIEIAKFQSCSSKLTSQQGGLNIDTLFIGTKAPNKILYQIIDQRVEERVNNGIEEEIYRLLGEGYTWENSVLGSTLAYREWKEYFEEISSVSKVSEKKSDLEEIKKRLIQRWKFDEHNYARRQMTWFKKDPRINWFDITQEDWQQKVDKLVENWYSNGSDQ